MSAIDLGRLTDSGIADDVSKGLAGGRSLGHASLITILRDAASGGIGSPEMQSLRQLSAWIDNGDVSTSAYDAYLFDAVVQGNPANATWTGGAATATSLGNLAGGATESQATKLIGKWFLGTDHPSLAGFESGVAYRTADLPLFGTHSVPSYLDSNQGALGDCYLLGCLGMVALNDPGVIQSMFTDNHDGTFGVRFVDGHGKPVFVTVDSQLPTFTNSATWANGSPLPFANGPFTWAALAEKAYAQLNEEGILFRTAGNAYGLIEGGGADPITGITGKSFTYLAPSRDAILAAWTANQEILITTDQKASGNFVTSHMFQVINFNLKTGEVQLHNPWGSAAADPTRSMTFWASIADLEANDCTLALAYGTVAPSLTVATSTGFAHNLTDATFDFRSGHDLMIRPTGTTVDLSAMTAINFTDGAVTRFAGSPLVDDLYYNATHLDLWKAHGDAAAHYAQIGWKDGSNPNGLFSTAGYLAVNRNVADAGLNPLTHYDQSGWKEGRDPSVLFDNEQYLAHNPEVRASGLSPLAHYLQHGQFEGRQIYAAVGKAADFIHGSFDAEYYLLANADVAAAAVAAGGDTLAFAYRHFSEWGWKEGRDPNADFTATGYLAANADVARAGVNPLTSYDQSGWREGRDPSAGFDNELYLARNPDVKAAGVDPLTHALQYGLAEGRQAYAAIGKASDFTHGSFDAEYYLLANPDIAKAALAAGGDSFAFAYRHFETNGWQEGRKADAYFDTAYYLTHNPDVAAAHIDPLAHYDQFGWKEGRAASAAFDTHAYLAANPDVAAAHIDPLLHYLQTGALEGRLLA